MPDGANRMEKVDEQLWIRTSGCGDRDYLVGNGHTFPGRISCYCPTRDVGFSISLSEIEEMSAESARWVAGFLAGNEPRPEDMFGPGIHDADDSDPRWARWRQAVSEFRTTGTWPHGPWKHLIPFPSGTTLPPFVWTLRGDEVWTWEGRRWVRAGPQPRRSDGLLEETPCVERGHCNMDAVTTVHAVCGNCGNTALSIPHGFTAEEWDHVQYGYKPTLV